MKKAFKMLGLVLAIIIVFIITAITYVKTALPNTGPPQVITIEKTPARLARGEYLANHVAVCMDCHSTRDWSRYAGPMLHKDIGGGGEVFNQQMGFPGTIYAPNITPYALGSWTDGELLRAITTGVNKQGKALFPLMGYHRFGKMDQEDIYSIIAYIRSLAPVDKKIAASIYDFPVNILINTMPQKAAFQAKPAENNQVLYGAYLVNVAGCVDCHSKTEKGKIIAGTEFGGGMEFTLPGGIVRSPNITFDATGIGSWRETDFVQRFQQYADSSYQAPTVAKSDFNTPMPWTMYGGMKREDLKAMYAYLKNLHPIHNQVERFQPN